MKRLRYPALTIAGLLIILGVLGQQQPVNVGTGPNTGNGDPLRTAFTKLNANDSQLYNQFGATGLLKGNGPVPAPLSSAAFSDVTSLWTGCTSPTTQVLGANGVCQTNGTGGVTSVGLTPPPWEAVSGSPITGSGTFVLTGAPGLAANQVLATPDAVTGAPSMRALVSDDIPPINLGASGNGGVTNQLPLTSLVPQAATTIVCNQTTGSATPNACPPIAVANMISAVVGVSYAATGNVVTMSGAQTINTAIGTINVAVGSTVLLTAQTTASQNGIWVVNVGAWARPANFPSGYVIAAFCVFNVVDYYTGQLWSLTTTQTVTGAPVTIDTTNESWSARSPQATSTSFGTVKNVGTQAFAWTAPSTLGINTSGQDCMSWNGSAIGNSSLVDAGNYNGDGGACVVSATTSGHIILDDFGTNPTSNAGSVSATSYDEHGTISGLSAATTVTLTFGATWNHTPSCTATTSVTATTPYVSAISASAVTFNFASLTGSLYYICL